MLFLSRLLLFSSAPELFSSAQVILLLGDSLLTTPEYAPFRRDLVDKREQTAGVQLRPISIVYLMEPLRIMSNLTIAENFFDLARQVVHPISGVARPGR